MSEIEMETWNQCTRLISSVMHYYNAYILNDFYETSTNEKEKSFLASLSPTAWTHVNLLGHYQFCSKAEENWIHKMLSKTDWKSSIDFVENI